MDLRQKQLVRVSEITVDQILKTNEHVDGGWFWSKYSANPYLGCQYGCTYCFLRQQSYGITQESAQTADTTDTFAHEIRVKTNAADLLDRELAQVSPDIIVTGDYQPIDKRFGISRQLLQACLNHGFPALVIAKSPAVLRDLDIIRRIDERSWACVVFSIAFSESGPRQKLLEPHASSIESRFLAMQSISEAGVRTGTAMMPIMPYLNDSEANLRAIVAQTQRHGGRFVMAGGLVLGDRMEPRFHRSLHQIDGKLADQYQRLYRGGFSPNDNSWSKLGRTVRDLCDEYGMAHRMSRYIAPGPLAVNKRIAEDLFLKIYEMELSDIADPDIPKLRELAWRIDESPTLVDPSLFSSEPGVDKLIEKLVTR